MTRPSSVTSKPLPKKRIQEVSCRTAIMKTGIDRPAGRSSSRNHSPALPGISPAPAKAAVNRGIPTENPMRSEVKIEGRQRGCTAPVGGLRRGSDV